MNQSLARSHASSLSLCSPQVDARAMLLATQLARFPAGFRTSLAKLSEVSPSVADLAFSFPLAYFALATSMARSIAVCARST